MAPKIQPQIIPPPKVFDQSFASDQASRGNTTWKTLISSSMSAGIACCPPNSEMSCPSSPSSRPGFLAAHKHTQPELYYILSGHGTIEIDGIKYETSPGTTVFIPGDAEHAVFNHGNEVLRWLYVFPGQFEDVVYRFRCESAYGEKPKL